jgi:hypothetical protein
VADDLARARKQVLGPAVLCNLNSKLAQIINHFLNGVLRLALEVFEIHEYAKFARLHN